LFRKYKKSTTTTEEKERERDLMEGTDRQESQVGGVENFERPKKLPGKSQLSSTRRGGENFIGLRAKARRGP